MKKVYLWGYEGYKPSRLAQLMKDLDASVVDIRYSPNSRNAAWGKSSLMGTHGISMRYYHIPELGNINYQGGAIIIKDLNAGVYRLTQIQGNIILMCVCRHSADCHRSVIAAELQRRGYEVTDISSVKRVPTAEEQIGLF